MSRGRVAGRASGSRSSSEASSKGRMEQNPGNIVRLKGGKTAKGFGAELELVHKMRTPREFKTDFDERWLSFLENKKLNIARSRIYAFVYFMRWKIRFASAYVNQVHENGLAFDAVLANRVKPKEKVLRKEIECNVEDLVEMARSRIEELNAARPKSRVPSVIGGNSRPVSMRTTEALRLSPQMESDLWHSDVSGDDLAAEMTVVCADDIPQENMKYANNKSTTDSALALSYQLEAETGALLREEISSGMGAEPGNEDARAYNSRASHSLSMGPNPSTLALLAMSTHRKHRGNSSLADAFSVTGGSPNRSKSRKERSYIPESAIQFVSYTYHNNYQQDQQRPREQCQQTVPDYSSYVSNDSTNLEFNITDSD